MSDIETKPKKSFELEPQHVEILPFRVIVHEIFCHFKPLKFSKKTCQKKYPEVMKKELSELRNGGNELFGKGVKFSLHGYFRRDSSRKIFMMFYAGIQVKDLSGEKGNWLLVQAIPYVDVEKILSLSLTRLEGSFFDDNGIFRKGEGKERKMKELRHLKMDELNVLDGENWVQMDKIRELVINRMDKFSDVFFQEQQFQLKYLRIFDTKNIFGKDWNVDLKNLVCLRLSYVNVVDEIFRKHDFPHLEELLLLACQSMTGEDWKRIDRSLKVLSIDSLYLSNSFFKNQEFRQLERLYLENSGGYSGNWSLNFENLEEIRIVNSFQLTDDFFSTNLFPALDEFSAFGVPLFAGENWKKLPKLESLSLSKEFPGIERIKKESLPDDCEINLY